MIRRFKSVKITHDILHRIDFFYIAELFRFMGILVCENILIGDGIDKSPEEIETEKNTIYNAEIYVGKREINRAEAEALGCPEERYQEKLKEFPGRPVFLYDDPNIQKQLALQNPEDPLPVFCICHEPVNVQKNILRKFLENVFKVVYEETDKAADLANQLQDLINLYVDNKLWLHSMNMQYYARRPSKAVSEAREAFLKVHDLLEAKRKGDGKKGQTKRLYEYAELWCEVKINNACNYMREILYYSIEKVAEGCKTLCKTYQDFCNAKILLGLCYEPSSNSANEALMAFDAALKEVKHECFASAIYYWVGKRYEPYPNRKKQAVRAYELAYERKAKFRNIFKLAIDARDRKDTKEAIEKFDEIIDRLRLKKKLHFLDPLELEYLFKTYVQECYLYYSEDNVIDAIRTGEEAVRLKEIVETPARNVAENQYFERFYKGDLNIYREILAKRFSIKVVYEMLAECYAKVFDEKRAEEYQKKLSEQNG